MKSNRFSLGLLHLLQRLLCICQVTTDELYVIVQLQRLENLQGAFIANNSLLQVGPLLLCIFSW